jgi:hypothetical protein
MGKHETKTVTVFEPQEGGGFTQSDLDELRSYPELENVKGSFLEFVWFYGNRTSPLYNISPQKNKIKQCLSKSKLEGLLSFDDKESYLSGNFPEHIQAAIERMGEFNATIRGRAHEINNKIFDNFEKIINRDVDAMEDTEETKKYVDICSTIVKGMPDLVKQIETSFGLKTKLKKDGEKQEGLMNLAMRSEN